MEEKRAAMVNRMMDCFISPEQYQKIIKQREERK
jgi:hypothetical protein